MLMVNLSAPVRADHCSGGLRGSSLGGEADDNVGGCGVVDQVLVSDHRVAGDAPCLLKAAGKCDPRQPGRRATLLAISFIRTAWGAEWCWGGRARYCTHGRSGVFGDDDERIYTVAPFSLCGEVCTANASCCWAGLWLFSIFLAPPPPPPPLVKRTHEQVCCIAQVFMRAYHCSIGFAV